MLLWIAMSLAGLAGAVVGVYTAVSHIRAGTRRRRSDKAARAVEAGVIGAGIGVGLLSQAKRHFKMPK